MPKTYVLDTNVLLHDPEALFAFQENEVVIPFTVIEEIDNQKQQRKVDNPDLFISFSENQP